MLNILLRKVLVAKIG